MLEHVSCHIRRKRRVVGTKILVETKHALHIFLFNRAHNDRHVGAA
jgi:hypothetical protein